MYTPWNRQRGERVWPPSLEDHVRLQTGGELHFHDSFGA